MILFQFGIGVLLIWILNWGWLIFEIFRYTPDWSDDNIDSDDIVSNFMKNCPPERFDMFQKVATMNPYMGMAGIAMLIASTIF